MVRKLCRARIPAHACRQTQQHAGSTLQRRNRHRHIGNCEKKQQRRSISEHRGAKLTRLKAEIHRADSPARRWSFKCEKNTQRRVFVPYVGGQANCNGITSQKESPLPLNALAHSPKGPHRKRGRIGPFYDPHVLCLLASPLPLPDFRPSFIRPVGPFLQGSRSRATRRCLRVAPSCSPSRASWTSSTRSSTSRDRSAPGVSPPRLCPCASLPSPPPPRRGFLSVAAW